MTLKPIEYQELTFENTDGELSYMQEHLRRYSHTSNDPATAAAIANAYANIVRARIDLINLFPKV